MDVHGRLRVRDGSAAAPSLTFRLDDETGLYRPGSDELAVVTGGVRQWNFAGAHLVPQAAAASDLGTSGARIRTLYADDLDLSDDASIDGDIDLGGNIVGASTIVAPTTFGSASDWTATTTNPTNRGWLAHYTRVGNRIFAEIQLTANASFTAGSGQYIIGLFGSVNTTVIPANMSIGTWQASIAGVLSGGNVRRQGANACRCTVNAGGTFGSGNGMTAGDALFLQVSYLVT